LGEEFREKYVLGMVSFAGTGGRKGFRVKAQVGKKEYDWFVDCGCTSSLMTVSFALANNLTLKGLKATLDLGTITGGTAGMSISQSTTLDFAVNKRPISYTFLLCTELFEDVVLGLDWLMDMRTTVDFAKNLVFWDRTPPVPQKQHPTTYLLGTRALLTPIEEYPRTRTEDILDQPLNEWKQHVPEYLHDLAPAFDETFQDVSPPHRPGFDCNPIIPEGKYKRWDESLRKTSLIQTDAVTSFVTKELARKWIQFSNSPVASAPLLVPKPHQPDELRPCIDFRILNSQILDDSFPLPLLNWTLFNRRGKKGRWYGKIDIAAAFHTLRQAKGTEWMTAFKTFEGLFEYLVMPFGIKIAPATWQRFANYLRRLHLSTKAYAHSDMYVDDALFFADSPEELRQYMREFVLMCVKENIKIGWKKCVWEATEVTYLGHNLTQNGQEASPDRIQAILDMEEPQNLSDVRHVIGFVSYYREYFRRYAETMKGLTDLLKKESTSLPFQMTPEAKQSFQDMKQEMMSPAVLAPFDWSRPIEVETDASDRAFCAVISQFDSNGKLRPVAFSSHKFDRTQQGYDTDDPHANKRTWEAGDRELYAILHTLEKYDYITLGRSIRVWSDHQKLTTFLTTMKLRPRHIHWMERLSYFSFVIQWREGKKMVTDHLTRRTQDGEPGEGFCYESLLQPGHFVSRILVENGHFQRT
jgi:hypothetical protein